MYTILFNKDKQLIQTGKIPLFVGETNLTKFRFLVPDTIEDVDMSDFRAIIKYQLPNGSKYIVDLQKDMEKYKSYLSYTLPVSSNFTSNSGYVYYTLAFIKLVEEGSDLRSMVYESDADFIEIRKSRNFEEVEQEPEDVNSAYIVWEADVSLFPQPGESNCLYIDTGSNKVYRWDDGIQEYVVVGSDYMDITKIIDS